MNTVDVIILSILVIVITIIINTAHVIVTIYARTCACKYTYIHLTASH